MPSDDARTRCVLVAPHREGGPARDLLERRGWIAHEASDLLAALAELCLLDRTLATDRARGRGLERELALVVTEPDRWSQLPAMLAATRRYVPAAVVWVLEDGTLRPAAGTPPDATPPDATPEPTPRGDVSPPRITAEEIDMLLERDGEES